MASDGVTATIDSAVPASSPASRLLNRETFPLWNATCVSQAFWRVPLSEDVANDLTHFGISKQLFETLVCSKPDTTLCCVSNNDWRGACIEPFQAIFQVYRLEDGNQPFGLERCQSYKQLDDESATEVKIESFTCLLNWSFDKLQPSFA
jgi:hypothetical protein